MDDINTATTGIIYRSAPSICASNSCSIQSSFNKQAKPRFLNLEPKHDNNNNSNNNGNDNQPHYPFQKFLQLNEAVKQTCYLPPSKQVQCIAKDFPISVSYLQNAIGLHQSADLDKVLRGLCDHFHGVLKPEKGSFKATIGDSTVMKVNAFRDVKTKCIFLDFVLMEGCSFLFRKALVQSKIILAPMTCTPNPDEYKMLAEAELQIVETKLKFWYEKPSLM